MQHLYVGVDIGSGSARAALFTATGQRLALAVSPIKQFRPAPDFVEQSSSDIWTQVCKVVNSVIRESGVKPEQVKGIGFDATCSLVSIDGNDQPVSVSPTGADNQNIIMWMDHRAMAEAAEINQTDSEVLQYVGGEVSPEMELPKLKWLKNHLPEQYNRAAKFFDLADYLVYCASGKDIRSVCTKVCKWTYLAHKKSWDISLLEQLGLGDLITGEKVGDQIVDLGSPAGQLTDVAAAELGLTTKTTVAVGIIDAHAGGVGVIGDKPESTLAIIGGTSSCHMAVSKEPVFVNGVWGPYWGAMVPGTWLSEGGQSAAGSLIDHVIKDSAFYPELMKMAEEQVRSHYDILNEEVMRLEDEDPHFMANFHLLGYHHGNRSPRANPHLKGMVSGLSMNKNLSELARVYLAAIQSVSYGTRHIIEAMNSAGHQITRIHMCGGGTKNPLWLREHANVTGCEIVLGAEEEAVLLGSAMLAATACGDFSDLKAAMAAMSSKGQVIKPDNRTKAFHDAKYRVFHEMYEDQMKYQAMMNNF
ncbi:FGGY-family carbohydrate kinase [Salinisphaera sp. G21_0]|uniref:FGGY-family carbohydrate kinase n=1 Tax=Salinisphaera sp. G21_0 TaxID=2821094 RepID=UPI001ADA4778|nr:FGGY-family carbohydrate kinase [Salinisphaera sp. G21_0]MBO9482078.1 FGGY-family carbohydrate kinase [Salinisphaera sp. G21_0]